MQNQNVASCTKLKINNIETNRLYRSTAWQLKILHHSDYNISAESLASSGDLLVSSITPEASPRQTRGLVLEHKCYKKSLYCPWIGFRLPNFPPPHMHRGKPHGIIMYPNLQMDRISCALTHSPLLDGTCAKTMHWQMRQDCEEGSGEGSECGHLVTWA